jgi:DNA polymerase-3 subunit epsilon
MLRRPRPLPTPDSRTPWREAEFCVLDVETTGLDLVHDEIVSFGAALVAQARIPCGRVAYRQVRPSRPVTAAALAVHGLRTADLAGAPSIAEELDSLTALLSGRVPVAHAAWIERAFLNRALRPRGWRLGRVLIDTAALLRAGRLADATTGREPNLEDAARRLGVPVHTPHHALGDAFTTAQVLLVLATRLERGRPGRRPRPLTVGDLHAVSRQHGGSRTRL